MSELIRQEAGIFLEAAWYGMGIAFAYDLLRILRRLLRFGDISIGIQDFLFWVAAGVIVFSMIFQCNNGTVRGYIMLALIFGAYIYHKSISGSLVKYVSKILNILITFLLKKPFKWFKMFLIRLLKLIGKPFGKFGMWLKRKLKGGKLGHGKEKRRKHHDKEKEKRKVRNLRH